MALYDLTKGLVKDDSGKLSDPADYEQGIAAALKRYSKHRPRVAVADLPGTGGNDLDLPADWLPDFSAVTSCEYPVGNVPATLLDRDLWQLYSTPAVTRLRLLAAQPGATETVRITYTILHDEASVPESDLDALACLAAANCLRQLAAAFGQTSDPIIQADVVNYRSKSDEFRRLADSLEKQYKDHLGLKDSDTTPPAMVTARPPERRRTRLTHW